MFCTEECTCDSVLFHGVLNTLKNLVVHKPSAPGYGSLNEVNQAIVLRNEHWMRIVRDIESGAGLPAPLKTFLKPVYEFPYISFCNPATFIDGMFRDEQYRIPLTSNYHEAEENGLQQRAHCFNLYQLISIDEREDATRTFSPGIIPRGQANWKHCSLGVQHVARHLLKKIVETRDIRSAF